MVEEAKSLSAALNSQIDALEAEQSRLESIICENKSVLEVKRFLNILFANLPLEILE